MNRIELIVILCYLIFSVVVINILSEALKDSIQELEICQQQCQQQ